MSRGVNKVILVATLGADPETRHMPSGGAVTNLRMVTNESWNDKKTGEKKESAEWHRVVTFNRLAEICAEYLRKGSQVYIEGRLQTRKWQAQDGTDKYTTEIVANAMQMLGSKGGGKPQGDGYSSYGEGLPSAGGGADSFGKRAATAGGDDFDEEIPF